MNILRELKIEYYKEEYYNHEGVIEIDRIDIEEFTQENEQELGFSITEEEKGGDRYLRAEIGGDAELGDGENNFIAITFDFEAFDSKQEHFTLEEVADRLEELQEKAEKIKRAKIKFV